MDKQILATLLEDYVECMLWSTADHTDEMEPLDENYCEYDLAPEFVKECEKDLSAFYTDNIHLKPDYDLGQFAHDFWLTRNGHGAGFWDRGLGEVGEKLSKAAKVYGGVDPYVGGDGMIYG